MKYTITTTLLTLICAVFFSISGLIHAQEDFQLDKIAQDYISRIGTYNTSDPVIVNPEAVTRDAVTESIETISKTSEEIVQEKERVIDEIKATVKEDIDSSIIEIRKQIEKPAYELQRSVDTERTQLFENITQTIESITVTGSPEEFQKIQDLKIDINTSIEQIKLNLETESGLPVNFTKSQRDVRNTLLRFQEVLEEKKKIIESRQGDLVFKDSDADGVSDYDELYIYKTDPNNAYTTAGDKTDGQKLQEGINPLSSTSEKIKYQDPRADIESFVSDSYRVEKVQLVKEGGEKLVFEGVALPNTYITLYVYSTPIIVTVKSDENGAWRYELNQELENGEHQIYVATVDTSGKIIARSNPILFAKSADAATIGIAGTLDTSISTQNFLKDNFILIALAILITVVILGMMFVGNHKTIGSALSELKNETHNK